MAKETKKQEVAVIDFEKFSVAQLPELQGKKEEIKSIIEAKQLEAKYQERKKFLVDEDYWRIYLLAECGEEEDVAKAKLLDYSDESFEDFKSAVLKAKEPKEEVKTDEITQENYHEEDVHEVATAKPHEFANYKEEVKHIEQVETKSEVTWESIFNDWDETSEFYTKTFLEYLEENYNVPTKK